MLFISSSILMYNRCYILHILSDGDLLNSVLLGGGRRGYGKVDLSRLTSTGHHRWILNRGRGIQFSNRVPLQYGPPSPHN